MAIKVMSGFSQDAGLDQVFLADDKLTERIVSASGIKKTETVLEIGAGLGNLTRALSRRAKKVIAIEIDERLKPALSRELGKAKNIEIIFGNALELLGKGKLKFDKVVSNPPYSISEPLVRLLFGEKFGSAILTLPWRFVERLTANPEEPSYSKFSLFAQSFFKIETVFRIPKTAWSPVPATESIVIRLIPRKVSGKKEILARELALQDDKKLKNALREILIKTAPKGKKTTKRKAKNETEGIGLPRKLLDKKISEMSLSEIREVINAIGKSAGKARKP